MPRTSFQPSLHGFHFDNDFINQVLGGLITTAGRCGGMVYAATDFYFCGVPIPPDTTLPSDGTPLSDYLYNRQIDSLFDMVPAFIEKTINPFESDRDRFSWGVDRTNQLGALIAHVDSNQPVHLGLISVLTGIDVHHQVLAIGYDLLGPNEADVRVYIYDPNHHDVVTTLTPDPPNNCFRSDKDSLLWRTYFVFDRYQPKRPMPFAGPATQDNWSWCSKCQGLFFAGNNTPGVCPAGGGHDGSSSGDYTLGEYLQVSPNQQNNWRWCSKCQGLFFGGNNTPGICPAGGGHDATGSGNYTLIFSGDSMAFANQFLQQNWRWCNKCQGLFFAGNNTPGVCPAGGGHDATGSGNYMLRGTIPMPKSGQTCSQLASQLSDLQSQLSDLQYQRTHPNEACADQDLTGAACQRYLKGLGDQIRAVQSQITVVQGQQKAQGCV